MNKEGEANNNKNIPFHTSVLQTQVFFPNAL